MEYKIVTCSGWTFKSRAEKLTKAVNDLIALGWEPLGGIVNVETGLSQTMIKRR